MEYVDAPAESMPFADGAFDVISSLNSLDHVDNIHSVLPEIERVLAPGGHFILFTELHEHPTINEPTTFGWEIREAFPNLRLVFLKEREKDKWNMPFDHCAISKRYGWLFAVYQKVQEPREERAQVVTHPRPAGEFSSRDLLRASPAYVKNFMLRLIQAQMGSVQDGKRTEISKQEIQSQWSATLHEVLTREFPGRYSDSARKESFGTFTIHYGFIVGQVSAEFWKGINSLKTTDPKALSDFTESFLMKVI
jgi:SAM-dependent methyltransferase